MLRKGFGHGFSEAVWEEAKREARDVLIRYARRGQTISYSTLVTHITAISLEAHDPRLFHFLGEISKTEHDEGRGLLTVLVVHKTGDRSPGPGFYELAQSCGRDVSERERCWTEELSRVISEWKIAPGGTVDRAPSAPVDFERLPIVLPDYPGEGHPFSRGRNPNFYRLEDLRDSAEGDTPRTAFFEKVLAGLHWVIGGPVPYAFITKNGEVRSLDAGCVKFLRNRREPRLDLVCDGDGIIRAVRPSRALLTAYEPMRSKLIAQLTGTEVLLDLPFDLSAPVDERRRKESLVVIRQGQAEFRRALLEAWEGRCAITRLAVSAVVDACHIYPYLGARTNDVRNGIPLRADLHRLFDKYLLTLVAGSAGLRVRMSPLLLETAYGKLEGKQIALREGCAPDWRLLDHHAGRFLEAQARGRGSATA